MNKLEYSFVFKSNYIMCDVVVSIGSKSANSALIFIIPIKQLSTLWMVNTVKHTRRVSIKLIIAKLVHQHLAIPGTVGSPSSCEATLRVIPQGEHPRTLTCGGGGGGGGR